MKWMNDWRIAPRCRGGVTTLAHAAAASSSRIGSQKIKDLPRAAACGAKPLLGEETSGIARRPRLGVGARIPFSL
jgi:hypothetical protein